MVFYGKTANQFYVKGKKSSQIYEGFLSMKIAWGQDICAL